MHGATLNQIPYFRAIGRHVGRSRVGLERRGAFPLLDDDKCIGAKGRLAAGPVDGGPILDAACLGMHGWDDRLEGVKDRATLTRFGGYESENMDHVCFLSGEVGIPV
jgi:hypothetical protein